LSGPSISASLDPEQLVVKANELDETIGFIFWLTETAIRVFHRKYTGFSTGHQPENLLA
jgi:hypothetical protein